MIFDALMALIVAVCVVLTLGLLVAGLAVWLIDEHDAAISDGDPFTDSPDF